MRSLHPAFRFVVLFLIALGACAPQPTSSIQGDSQPTPSVVPINLGGPEMAINSTWLYADGTVLVAVPAGVFTMGGGKLDNPLIDVMLQDYWIYSTEVTNSQYAYCVEHGGCTPPSESDNPGFDDYLHANDPVVGVDHSQAGDYCEFVRARLPSEAEWEKAARGPESFPYPWGDEAPSCGLLNFGDCVGETTQVNIYPDGRSPYGAFDMGGNTLEWTADWYGADYYLEAPADDPTGPGFGTERAVRSSAFNSGRDRVPASTRSFSRPETHRDNLGFRCVVDDPAVFAPFCEYPGIYGTDGVGGPDSGRKIEVSCPALTIDQNSRCVPSGPLTDVLIDGYEGWPVQIDFDLSTYCNNSIIPHVPPIYTCSGPGQIQICSECKVTLTDPPSCPVAYTWDPNLKTCLGAASPGECLPGSTYDPAGQCCVFEPGDPIPTADPSLGVQDYPLTNPDQAVNCPPGTWMYFNPPYGVDCIAVPVQSPYCISEGIVLNSCTPGGGGEDGCQITEQSCGNSCLPYGYIYDAAACTCSCLPG